MRAGIRTFAKYNPITVIANSVRALTLGLPLGNDAWITLTWVAGILIVFVPIAVWRYRKIS